MSGIFRAAALLRPARRAFSRVLALTLAACPLLALSQDRPTLQNYDADTVLATVGDGQITLGDLLIARPRLPANVEIADQEIVFQNVLSSLTTTEMFAQAALQSGLAEGRVLKLQLAAMRRNALSQAYLSQLARGQLTEVALRTLYQELTANEESRTPFMQASYRLIQADRRDEAEAALAAARDGANFADLARERSTHLSNANGGLIDYQSPSTPIDQAALTLAEPGDLSEVIEFQSRFYVVRLEGKRLLAYEQVLNVLRRIGLDRIAAQELERLRGDIRAQRADTLPPAGAILQDELLRE